MMVEVDENFELTCIHGPKGVCVCVSVCVLIAAGKGYPLQYSGLENSMDYSPWGLKESDMTERLLLSLSFSLPLF